MFEISQPTRIQSARSYQLNLLDEASIMTEGIKYSGSKLKLLPSILSIIQPLPIKRVFDGFSGTTRVSQALAQCGYEVISNDIAIWSKVFAECYLKGAKAFYFASGVSAEIKQCPYFKASVIKTKA